MNPADDPDMTHLIKLLAMLPGSDDVAFWNTVDRNGRAADGDDSEPTGNGYLLGKMNIGIRHLLNGDPFSFCQYLLKFFDGDRPSLWTFLDRHVVGSGFTDLAGERWTRDLCDTAWRLLVRYHSSGRDDLDTQWPSTYR